MLPDLHQILVSQIVRVEAVRQIDDGGIGKPLADRCGSVPSGFVAIHQNDESRQISEQPLLCGREVSTEQGYGWASRDRGAGPRIGAPLGSKRRTAIQPASMPWP